MNEHDIRHITRAIRRDSAAAIIAGAFSTDIESIRDYRYQRYVAPMVYSIGDCYFAAYRTKPRHDVGGEWRKHADQFWAEKSGTTLWVCDMSTNQETRP